MIQTDHRTKVAAQKRTRMRTRLLAAALELMATQGVAALTIDQIIARAEVSRGTFYKYFDAPEALIQTLGETVSDAIIRVMHPLIDQLNDEAARVATGVRTLLHLVAQYPALGHFMVRTGWPVTALDHAFLTLVGKNIKKSIQSGRFAPMPLDVALSLLSGTLVGTMHAIISSKQPKNFSVQTSAAILRALGIPADEAMTLSTSVTVLPVIKKDAQLSDLLFVVEA